MAFTNAERVDVRRFCGYGAFGGVASPAFGYRFFKSYGTLEFKLNNLAVEEEAVVRATYLPNLATLETAIFGASSNLDTDRAAVWTHNKREVADRTALYLQVRRQLCDFLGVEPGPAVSSSGGIQFIV